mgnify:CR=1|jgi:hypothetical protein|tara:strand:- start:508 stop:684 length:177 start_codon:yes stop_codon:yes gene_type:complete
MANGNGRKKKKDKYNDTPFRNSAIDRISSYEELGEQNRLLQPKQPIRKAVKKGGSRNR